MGFKQVIMRLGRNSNPGMPITPLPRARRVELRILGLSDMIFEIKVPCRVRQPSLRKAICAKHKPEFVQPFTVQQ
jgi:hypothetical protein